MNDNPGYMDFSHERKYMPLEEKLATEIKSGKFVIGIPKEVSENENRVPLVPESVSLLVENGHQVKIEREAGKRALFTDEEYAAAGAEICETASEVYKADFIIKIMPPTDDELEIMGRSKVLFSSVFLPDRDKKYFEKLMLNKIKAIGYEYIKDKSGAFPVLKGMSEIVGNTSIIIAAEQLSSTENGKGKMLGGFPGLNPSEVVIIGAGTVAEYAARTALGMGASVKIFDDAIYKLREIQHRLGQSIFTSIIQPKVMQKALRTADVVIAAKHSDDNVSPCLVSEEMIMEMKNGSVIVDVSIDQGGCFETSRMTTHQNPVYQTHGITHYCVPNIASRVPHTASYALSNYLSEILLRISKSGSLDNMLKQDMAFCKGVYVYHGLLCNPSIGHKFNIAFTELQLLLSAF